MDPANVNNTMQALAFGEAMAAAAKDYKEEYIDKQEIHGKNQSNVHIGEYFDDPELERLYEDRLTALKEASERRAKEEQKGIGSYQDICEGEFLEIVTKTKSVIVHFYEVSFERCRIIDKHLEKLAVKHKETRFIKVSAPDAPFFVQKLNIRTLPCIIAFKNGVSVDRIVGFGELGGRDDFLESVLEDRLIQGGALDPVVAKVPDSSEYEAARNDIRRSVYRMNRTASDEDSDFD